MALAQLKLDKSRELLARSDELIAPSSLMPTGGLAGAGRSTAGKGGSAVAGGAAIRGGIQVANPIRPSAVPRAAIDLMPVSIIPTKRWHPKSPATLI